MVSFHDNPEKYNSVGMLAKLDEEVIALLYKFAECSMYCLRFRFSAVILILI